MDSKTGTDLGDIIIEKISNEDIEGVAVIYSEGAKHIKSETQDAYFDFDTISTNDIKDAINRNLKHDNKLIPVAKVGGQLTGFIAGEIIECFFPLSPVRKVGYISGAYVSAANRCKGILCKLESGIIEFFKQSGVKYSELHCLTENRTAMNAWNAVGYKNFREQMRKEII